MSTDLRAALREAVADAPYDESDLRDVLVTGSRRVRRRVAAVASAGLAAVSLAVPGPVPSAAVGRAAPTGRGAAVGRRRVRGRGSELELQRPPFGRHAGLVQRAV